MLFFILFSVVLSILSPAIRSQTCIGYDSSRGVCVECPLYYYQNPSFSSSTFVNNLTNCFPKSSDEYNKKLYVSNTSCNSGSCDGSKAAPFESLITAIMALHNMEVAQKYGTQNIEIYLLGSPHYVLDSEFSFNNMRLFRGFNASISIGPLFCEDDYVFGCVFGFRNEKIDLFLKSQNFQLEISGSLILYNMNIFANDIILNSTIPCYSQKSLCCPASSFSGTSECSLLSQTVPLNEKTKLNSLLGLFQLRMAFDPSTSTSANWTQTPTLNLTNVNLANFWAIKGETGWLALIVANPVGYNLTFVNVIIDSGFFPFGIFISVSLEDDPYYNFLSIDDTWSRFSSPANVNLTIFQLQSYNAYNILISATSGGTLAPALINIYSEQSPISYFTFNDLLLQNLTFSNEFFFFAFLGPAKTGASALFNRTICRVNTLFNLLKAEGLKINADYCSFDWVFPGPNSIFRVSAKSWLVLDHSLLMNTNFTDANNFIKGDSSDVQIQNTRIADTSETLARLTSGTFSFLNSTLSTSYVISYTYFFSFSETSINFQSSAFIDSRLSKTTNQFFYIFASQKVSINFTDFQSLRTAYYTFILFESSVLLVDYSYRNILLNNTVGIKNPKWSHQFLMDFSVGSINSLEMNNFTALNVTNLECLVLFVDFNRIIVSNFLIVNLTGLQYYEFIITSTATSYKDLQTIVRFENFTIVNLTMNRNLDLFYIMLVGFTSFKNCVFQNVGFSPTITAARDRMIIMSNIRQLKVEDSTMIVQNRSYFLAVYYLSLIDEVIFINTTFFNKQLQQETRIPAICLSIFINFTFINNTVLNMSLIKNPMDIGDETGVVSLLASGAYASSLPLQTSAMIIGNYFSGNSAGKYGVLGLIGCTSASIINNTFEWGEAYYSGSLAIYLVDYVQIEGLVVRNSISNIGTGLYITNVGKSCSITRSSFKSLSGTNAAGLYLANSLNVVISDMEFENLNASQKAGGLFVSYSGNVSFSRISSRVSAAGTAGFLYLDTSDIIISGMNCILSSSSQIAGALYLLGINSNLTLVGNNFVSCYSAGDGAILSSLNIWNLTIVDSRFLSSVTSSSGNGIINLSGYYILKAGEIPNFGSFNFFNISCGDNIAKLGGCLYYSSNNHLILEEVDVNNVTGSLFNLESDGSVILGFYNIRISNSNFQVLYGYDYGFDLTNPLLVFINLEVDLENVYIGNNTAQSSLIKISSANVTILNAIFENFFNTYSLNTVSPRFLYISDSFVSLENSQFRYSNTSLQAVMILEIRSSTVVIEDTEFKDSKTTDLACVSTIDSQVNISRSRFFNMGATLAVFSWKSSGLVIEDSRFEGNRNMLDTIVDEQASDLTFSDDAQVESLWIKDSVFCNQGKNILMVKSAYSVSIINSSFTTSQNSSFARGIYFDQNAFIRIVSSQFTAFYSELGAAISLYQTSADYSPMRVSIESCVFRNNSANFAGAINLQGSIMLNISKTRFESNRALISTGYNSKVGQEDTGKGGCIVADCEYYQNFSILIESSEFVSNQAALFGPTVLSKSSGDNSVFASCSFTNNTDFMNFTQTISSTPFKAFILSSDFTSDMYSSASGSASNSQKISKIREQYEIETGVIASGQEFNFSIILTDNFNQLLLFESKVTGELSCFFLNITESGNLTDNQTVFVDKGTSQASAGILTFTSTKLVMMPENNISCSVKLTLSDSVLFTSTVVSSSSVIRSISLPYSLYVRRCIIGELLMEDHTCFQCLPGTYLLDDPMSPSDSAKKCLNCPDNAYCKGGSYISPYAGYWRYSNRTSLILECPTKEACLGIGETLATLMDLNNLTETELVSGKCHPNYWGNLCYTCVKGYARIKQGQNCEVCSSMYLIYIKMALSFIFIISYIAMQAKIFSNIDKNDPNFAIMMKLFLNHFQTISMITLVDLGWTVDFNFYFNVLDYLSFLFQDFFIIDCLVVDIDENLLVQKIIFTILLPIIISLLMIAIWMIGFFVLLYRKSKNTDFDNKFLIFMSEKLRITLLILVFILYPEILRKCFSLLNCLLIDDKDQVTILNASPNVQCWNGDHKTWVLTVSMPGILVWGVFTPLIIFFVLRKYKSKIQNFIYETHKNFSQRKTFHQKKEQIIQKMMYLDIDSALVDKIFTKKRDFPLKNEIRYRKGAQIFSEIIEVNVKTRKEIMEEMKDAVRPTPPEFKELSQILDIPMENSDQLIQEPSNFFDYIRFIESFKERSLTKSDLVSNLIRIREEFSLIEKAEESQDLVLMGEFSKKYIPEKENEFLENDKSRPKTYLVIKNLGFVYRGYRPDFYFWETVMFTRKFLLIFIGVFTEFFPKKTKPTMLIIILVGYIYMQIKFRPYQFEYLNKLEAYSLVVAFLTGNIGILLFSDFLKSFSAFFLFLIFAINLFYFGFWVRCLLKYGNLEEKLQTFLKWLRLLKRRIIKALFG